MTRKRASPRPVIRLALALFFIVTLAASVTTVWRLSHWLTVDGPNTVGEAGKVYFAARFARGETLFVTADDPPHYASMHGALLHAAVGALADDERSMYFTGRAISLFGTAVALACAIAILRRFGVGIAGCATAVMLLFVSEPIVQHAVSYRPDHWNLALAAVACWLLVAHRGKAWRLPILAAIPAIAFFIKAPGAALIVSILLGLGAEGRWKQGVAVALASLALLGGAVACVEWLAEGPFIGGLESGLDMPTRWYFVALVGGEVKHWPLWIMPVAIVMAALPARSEGGRRIAVIGGFFMVAFVTAAGASMRAGGGPYYFLEATLWGIVLTVAWADVMLRRNSGGLVAAAAVVFAALWVMPAWTMISTSYPITDDTPMDTAVRINRRVGAARPPAAAIINRNNWLCYSDDAGLNIMLDRPAVIYPLLMALQLERGLNMHELTAPIRERRYDVVVLSGVISYYLGKPNIPPQFVEALEQHYERIDTGTNYVVFVRKARDASR